MLSGIDKMLGIGDTGQNKYFTMCQKVICSIISGVFVQVFNHSVHQLVTTKHIFKPVECKEQFDEASFMLGLFSRHLFLIVTGLICLIIT